MLSLGSIDLLLHLPELLRAAVLNLRDSLLQGCKATKGAEKNKKSIFILSGSVVFVDSKTANKT